MSARKRVGWSETAWNDVDGGLDSTEVTEAGVEEINTRYVSHCIHAREIAEAYFDSSRILNRLLATVHSKPSS